MFDWTDLPPPRAPQSVERCASAIHGAAPCRKSPWTEEFLRAVCALSGKPGALPDLKRFPNLRDRVP